MQLRHSAQPLRLCDFSFRHGSFDARACARRYDRLDGLVHVYLPAILVRQLAPSAASR